MSATENCTLCGLETPDPPLTDDGVDGSFCCRGCLEVARSLDDPATADAAEARETVPETEASVPDDAETAYLQVDGMHCASCEAFLERRATADEGVAAADANFPAEAMRVHYDPDATDPESV
ncbi:cation transporter, partial [Halolamina salina]|uniref:cation transporter n=1 Tax=Halolamina salina TaxID=1220023 RepID=UPI00361F6CDA